jgi:predicted transglutaminase-like cysteine proteinase
MFLRALRFAMAVACLCAAAWPSQGAEPAGWDLLRLRTAAAQRGGGAVAAEQALEALAPSAVAMDDAERVQAVNQFVNRRVVFRDDMQVWGQIDYWASPLETFAKGQGDCEDYAIAKYFILRALGLAVGKLRLVYVRAMLNGPAGPSLAHMVLAFQATPRSEPLILDNLIGEVRPASARPDLTPVFSFNADGLWQGNGDTPAGDPTARLSRWRDVLTKAREEGFP